MSDVWDEVWAEEGGRALRVDMLASGVRVTILDKSGAEDRAFAKVTIARWRWDRIVAAMNSGSLEGR